MICNVNFKLVFCFLIVLVFCLPSCFAREVTVSNSGELVNALSDSNIDVINLRSGSYSVSEFSLEHNVSLYGESGATLNGGDSYMIQIGYDSSMSMSGLSVRNSHTNASLSALVCYGNLTVRDCIFADNIGNNGGVIAIEGGTVNITDSTFTGNRAVNNGGAIQFNSGILYLKDCTFTNNRAANVGGAIFGAGELLYGLHLLR